MLPLRFTRIPGLFTHCSHGLRIPAPRYLSRTAVRKVRRRGAPHNRVPTSTASIPHSVQEKEGPDIDDDRITVNLFEKDGIDDGSMTIPSEHPDTEFAQLERFEKKLDKEIEDTDKELAESSIHVEAPESLIRATFTEEELAKIRRQVSSLRDEDVFTITHQIKPVEELSASSKIFLQRLNDSLDAASLRPTDEKVRRTLWRYYEHTKMYIPNLLKIIPNDAWNILWTAISENSPLNPNRAAHIKVLSQDMIDAGRALTQEQRFARIEGLFLEDLRQDALQLWEAGLQDGDAGNPEYLEMGIRMYSQTENVKRAEELVDVLFKLYTSWNPRVIIPVMIACMKLNTQKDFDKAFALYLRLRDRLSSDITMDDYDQVSVGFLRGGQKQYALAVFRDMMLTGDPEASNFTYRTVLDRMGSFMSATKDAKELNTLSLDSLFFLPRQFQNKFFYASWMKKLIGMGQIDDAAQVVELMYERGVKPDAKHINGLIGGWFRSGNKAAHLRAEKTAWSMIQARLDFVRERKQKILSEVDAPRQSVLNNTEGALLPTLEEQPTPIATVETFSILVQWYLRRGMFENVRHLRNLLVDAEIPMNSYFMNHLLYAELRNRSHREVWTRFEVMSRNVTPDTETFACLWECMKSHVDPARNVDPSGFPSPRQLFARMYSWYNSLTGQSLRDARADLNINLYNDIIQAFCLGRDLEGSFVVLQTLKDMWKLYPEPKTIKMLVMQIARLTAPLPLNLGKPSHRKSRQITASREYQEHMAHALQVLDLITRDRRADMEERGVSFGDLTPEQQGEENHKALLQLLYVVMMKMRGETFDGVAAIAEVAAELGVGSLDIENSMALEV